MKYLIYNNKLDDSVLVEYQDETEEVIQSKGWEQEDCSVSPMHTCRGKGCETNEMDEMIHERYDWYGISTGHYCNGCYKSNYPYRKDRYPTIEHDGHGERLDSDY